MRLVNYKVGEDESSENSCQDVEPPVDDGRI